MNRQEQKTYLVVLILATIGLWAAISLAGCTVEQQKKTGLTILNAVVDARNTTVKVVKEVDTKKQADFVKRYDAVQSNPNDNVDKQAAALAAIDVDRVGHDKSVTAAYDFLQAIGHACEIAKLAVMNINSVGQLAIILAPVIATAIDVERGLKVLGINANFVSLLTGGK